jgi:hypothetical protein
MDMIDEFLPHYDVVERHEVFVAATPTSVYRCVRALDVSRMPVTAALLALRGIPHLLTGSVRPSRRVTIDQLTTMGFVILGDRPPVEVVLGVVGRFWRPTSGIVRISADGFAGYAAPGHARAVWNFRIEPERGGCRLRTETRVQCLDASARRRFRLYWGVVGPFSGLIRRDMLRAIRRDAEGSAAGHTRLGSSIGKQRH